MFKSGPSQVFFFFFFFKKRMFNMARMTMTGKQCRAARHVRISLCAQPTVFINYSTTLCQVHHYLFGHQIKSPGSDDAVKQVFPKRV